ncbi:hypothetical protein BpHYR1_004218, partial [Brachionus plicatilis]
MFYFNFFTATQIYEKGYLENIKDLNVSENEIEKNRLETNWTAMETISNEKEMFFPNNIRE